ncbi:MAG: tripartite tricarboxylate transporter substrate binding protein [Rhodocyclaceae bacterium]|nr:tripartite tricarboxylate transporter substrate binding protein [Rhodocyclaceae bacterium]MCA3076630.1 tripartite tricarboxylate transporter substrate binding protein [Rhodocyclaceae bacterium]MCA3089649.1 tripartite tricarboxylate transporter substrate binding protein [Rhodocyclaceae bacterium]MCA3094489.1 tripartite tricarboxylate transporter substrate binding protein [Rhodocyclaceae bacterium]MCA3098137.1 tripartite tricarboxylate transporter substrate binding protein [Rhodocyclaceae bact
MRASRFFLPVLGALSVGLLTGPFAPPEAAAQAWPARPVRMIVPFAPGGAADLVSRVVAERLSASYGQQFIADNRSGAGGTIGYELLARAAPDGYTLGTASDSSTLLPFTYRNLPWDPRNFTGISLLTTQPLVLAVHTAVPATSLKELVAHARTVPGKLSFGSSGHGHPQHLAGEMIKLATGIDMTHIPYKGGGAAIIDLVGGQIPIVVLGSSPVIPHHRAGKVRILAVVSPARSSALPDIPTLDEAGVKGVDLAQWMGLAGPPKLPRDLVKKLNAEVAAILANPGSRKTLEGAGFDPSPSTPEAFEAKMREGVARWEKLLPKLKIRFD